MGDLVTPLPPQTQARPRSPKLPPPGGAPATQFELLLDRRRRNFREQRRGVPYCSWPDIPREVVGLSLGAFVKLGFRDCAYQGLHDHTLFALAEVDALS